MLRKFQTEECRLSAVAKVEGALKSFIVGDWAGACGFNQYETVEAVKKCFDDTLELYGCTRA